MVKLTTPVCEFGAPALPFNLPGTDWQRHTLETARGPNGLLVMFICNHCPYVRAIMPRLIEDTRKLKELGIGCIAIMSNDSTRYPDDNWYRMQCIAAELEFPFPYTLDSTQEVAKAYGAVCTPDFFGYNSKLELQYRGRFDASGKERNAAPADMPSDLLLAMQQIAETGAGPAEQHPSIGCSIKWRGVEEPEEESA